MSRSPFLRPARNVHGLSSQLLGRLLPQDRLVQIWAGGIALFLLLRLPGYVQLGEAFNASLALGLLSDVLGVGLLLWLSLLLVAALRRTFRRRRSSSGKDRVGLPTDHGGPASWVRTWIDGRGNHPCLAETTACWRAVGPNRAGQVEDPLTVDVGRPMSASGLPTLRAPRTGIGGSAAQLVPYGDRPPATTPRQAPRMSAVPSLADAVDARTTEPPAGTAGLSAPQVLLAKEPLSRLDAVVAHRRTRWAAERRPDPGGTPAAATGPRRDDHAGGTR